MIFRTALISATVLLAACSGDSPSAEERAAAQEYYRTTNTVIPAVDKIMNFPPAPQASAERPPANPDRNAYFGDLHVHTTYSFDASAFGTTATPADAYRYARGEMILHPSGIELQLKQPLDFYAVTDHAVFLGLINEAADTSTAFSTQDVAKPYHDINASVGGGLLDLSKRSKIFFNFISDVIIQLRDGSIKDAEINNASGNAWQETVKAANAAYEPGTFTTFAGYEFTSSTAAQANLHRNVIFRGTDRLPAVPFSRLNSINPEGLWDWMDGLREQGIESLAIPHNSNGSDGAMFELIDWARNPIDADYAQQRIRNEPLVEITQIKGTSDTHPLLSETDEWANFEILTSQPSTKLPSAPPGSYVRDAWLRGLALEEKGAGNPYKFGVVGSTDTHIGAASIDESNHFGKVGIFDSTAEKRGSVPASWLYGTALKLAAPNMLTEVEGETYLAMQSYEQWSASGLAGVWAEENTRESIYAALRRKETFATSGPRIRVRFFAGYELSDLSLDSHTLIGDAYRSAEAMGGNLQAKGEQHPTFLAWAVADANTQPLQRLQIIKGWLENGEHRERVYDVACPAGLKIDPNTHRCPDNGAHVDLSDCSTTAGVGAAELKTLWRDPDFTPGEDAFYYVRTLENPVCRWSTWDAIRSGNKPRPDLPSTIQERAWSSPIWYSQTAALSQIK
jgi:hypothetical protein